MVAFASFCLVSASVCGRRGATSAVCFLWGVVALVPQSRYFWTPHLDLARFTDVGMLPVAASSNLFAFRQVISNANVLSEVLSPVALLL